MGDKRSIDDPFHDAGVNLRWTLNIFQEVRRAGTGRLVVSSSAGIFGEMKRLLICEDHPVEPDTHFNATKLWAERVGLYEGLPEYVRWAKSEVRS